MPDASPIFFQRDPATGAVVFEFTGRKTNGGQLQGSWDGSAANMTLTFAHGLGVKPLSVVATGIFGIVSGGGGSSTRPLVFFYQREVSDNTNVVLRIQTVDGSIPPAGETYLLDWIATLSDSLIAIGGAGGGGAAMLSAQLRMTANYNSNAFSNSTPIPFGAVDFDNGGMAPGAFPADRLTVTMAGVYRGQFHGRVDSWRGDATTQLEMWHYTAAGVPSQVASVVAGVSTPGLTNLVKGAAKLCAVGDYFRCHAYNASVNQFTIITSPDPYTGRFLLEQLQ